MMLFIKLFSLFFLGFIQWASANSEPKKKPQELSPESLECRETGLFKAGENLNLKSYDPIKCRQVIFQAKREGEVVLLNASSGVLQPKGGFQEEDGRKVLELAANEVDCRMIPSSAFRRTFELQLRQRGTPLWRDASASARGSRDACLRAQDMALVRKVPLVLDLANGNLTIKMAGPSDAPPAAASRSRNAHQPSSSSTSEHTHYEEAPPLGPEEQRLLENVGNGYELIPQH